MDTLIHQLKSLIQNKELFKAQPIVSPPIFSTNWWNSLSKSDKRIIFFSIATLSGITYYILSPSFSSDPAMFTKRPDKYTTGLINMRNDCFANSSLQAYLALPGLTDYLNTFIGSYNETLKYLNANQIDLETILDNEELQNIANTKFKNGSKLKYSFEIPLHIALARIVHKLQETQMTSRTISVWTFLHALEKIFNAKISKSQHDAQELTQLINETLENENINFHKTLKLLKVDAKNKSKELDKIDIPEFPFSGLQMSLMRCVGCSHISKPQFTPFLMVTLHTPQSFSSDLETLLDENESETIDGYQCIKCRISQIVANEESHEFKNDKKEKKIISKLAELNKDPHLFINVDLQEDVEDYIKSYKKANIDISQVTSTVLRKNLILKPPKIFGLHLSRSTFNGYDITRNSCHVSFKDHLTLSIGQEYHNELKQFQKLASQEEDVEKIDIKSKILTTDENDMEDEEVQREDFVVEGDADDDEDDEDDDDTDEEKANDDSSVTSTESEVSLASNSTLKDGSVTTTQTSKESEMTSSTVLLKSPETLNKSPITQDQTDHLKRHFRKFKFNDNDIYKYKLKAVIRHQGSHTQGHYDCYRAKPLFVKDKEGTIFKLSPEISEDNLKDFVYNVEVVDEEPKTDAPSTSPTAHPTLAGPQANATDMGRSASLSRRRKFSLSLSGSANHEIGSKDSVPGTIAENAEFKNAGGNNIRRRFSNIMGRRPSVVQADPAEGNLQEVMQAGLTTPAEFVFDDSYFLKASTDSESERPSNQPQTTASDNHKIKMTKIPSLLKHPYWKISDAQVTEVSRASVFCETASVYMLYYERVDRQQVSAR